MTVGVVNVSEQPLLTSEGTEILEMDKGSVTVMVILPVLVQDPDVAVTVYVVVVLGLTVTVEPLPAPLFHVKLLALDDTESCVLPPLQMVLLVALEVTLLMVGTVVTVWLSVLVHPLAVALTV